MDGESITRVLQVSYNGGDRPLAATEAEHVVFESMHGISPRWFSQRAKCLVRPQDDLSRGGSRKFPGCWGVCQ